ncbi:hypothetical protein H2199_002725 [Coniosporium tulheliwenetii]|uniref:Uncharacterized protein n=1 Tax=Coniosporium tulheliwenetii TaxID=3383036 RepID=A0ACC2ZEJ5_9PEZI|nr:hypothetical protein H2199_002725 [Cladosporium sp. JES 115]
MAQSFQRYDLLDAFVQYHQDQEAQARSSLGGPALPALGHALSGSAGTAISNLITYPLSLVIARLQVQKQFANEADNKDDVEYKGVLDAAQKIYEHEGGIPAFYSGVLQDTAKSVADSFLFFLAYNYLRERRQRKNGSKLPMIDELSVGMLAGAFAKLFTTPIQNIVTRKQTAAMVAARSRNPSVHPQLSTKDIALQIRDEKGLQGFWSGYSAALVLTLNPSLTFLLHEMFLRTLVPRSKRDNPGARLTFLLAATSKAIASSVTYPFALAKARAQVSSQTPMTSTGMTSEKFTEPVTARPARRATRNTIFHTILRIAKTEGIQGLYQGLGGDVLKGVFQHGLTMLMKERIHVVIVQLYYLILRAMKKYPSPEEVAKAVSEQAQEARNSVSEKTAPVVANAQDALQSGTEKAKEWYVSGSAAATGGLEKGKEMLGGGSEKAQQVYEQGKEKASEVYQSGKDRSSTVYVQGKEKVAGLYQQGKERAYESGKQGTQIAVDKISGTGEDAIRDVDGTDKKKAM